jgi:hypothetical protein
MRHEYEVCFRPKALDRTPPAVWGPFASADTAVSLAADLLDQGNQFVQVMEDGVVWIKSTFLEAEQEWFFLHLPKTGKKVRVSEFGRAYRKGGWVLVPA